jgi:elongation factor G
MILSGIGLVQLEIIVKRIKTRYNVEVELVKPKIPYKETIKKKAEAEGKYKRQSGGRGQYGHCFLRVEPLERGKGYEFVDEIFGGVIPKNYIPSVEKGVLEKMSEGVIAGYPIVDIKVTLFDGSYHEVDSSDMAFRIAARMALQKAVLEGSPCILEPIMEVEIKAPEEFLGSIISDINSRRGRVLSFEKEGKYQKIKAHVPLSEIQNYTMDLRSLTKGAGKYTMKLSHYEELPPHLAQPLIEEYQKSKVQQNE